MAWGPFNAGSGGAQSGGGTAKEIAYEDTLGISASNIQEALDKVLGNTLPKLTVTTTAGSALTITDGQSTITGTATGGSPCLRYGRHRKRSHSVCDNAMFRNDRPHLSECL